MALIVERGGWLGKLLRPPTTPISVGPNSLTYHLMSAGGASLPSNARNVASGSIVLAWAAMGTVANLSAPTDSRDNTYSPLLAAHTYVNWPTSGQRLYAATGVTGDAALVVSEAKPDVNDEVTLSTLAVSGGAITHVDVTETPTTGPVTTPTVAVAGRALLISSWWGDGGTVQDSVTPSIPVGEANSGDGAGWVKLHELTNAMAVTNVVQVCLAVRQVTLAGSYACKWTANDGQGGVAYMLSVE